MTKTRRIIHHACWFALLGPHLGVPVAITREALTDRYTLGELLSQIVLLLPVFMGITWILGGVAALLTGIATACLPGRVYDTLWLRIPVCGALGSLFASLYWLMLIRDFDAEFVWMSAGPGLLAGLLMGWIVPHLPFRGAQPVINVGELNGN